MLEADRQILSTVMLDANKHAFIQSKNNWPSFHDISHASVKAHLSL